MCGKQIIRATINSGVKGRLHLPLSAAVGWLIILTILVAGCAGMDKLFAGKQVKSFRTDAGKESRQGETERSSPEAAKLDPANAQPPRDERARRRVSQMMERIRAFEKSRQQRHSRPAGSPVSPEADSASIVSKLDNNTIKFPEPAVRQQAHDPRSLTTAGAGDRPPARPGAGQKKAQKPTVSQNDPEVTSPTGKRNVPKIRITDIVSLPQGEPTTQRASAAKAPAKPAPEPEIRTDNLKNSQVHKANQQAKIDIPEEFVSSADQLAGLIRQLEEKLEARPEDVGAQVKLQLIRTILGQWQQVLNDKNKAPSKSTGSELAEKLVRLINTFDNASLSPAERANQALTLIEELQRLLKQNADLRIADIKLCREVVSFGCYKLMSKDYFQAGKSRAVIVYLELDNFVSTYLKDKRMYQTLLALTVEVIDPKGKVHFRHHYERIEDLANRRRRDFYLAPPVNLPPMRAGDFILKVTVEDLVGNKVAQASTDLKILPRR